MMFTFLVIVTVFSAADGIKEVYKTINKGMYCPTRNWCKPPSSHIVCKNQPPDELAKSCKKYSYRKFGADGAKNLLNFVNKLRGQAASHTLVGKDGKKLPRAYGMIKLKWDGEIASLMHYGFKTCKDFGYFECMKSERHPSLVLTCLRSINIAKSLKETEKGFIDFYNSQRLTSNELLKTPDLNQYGDPQSFLKLLQSQATRFGCGAGVFTLQEIRTYVCCGVNYQTPTGKPVYNITPPVRDTGFSKKCGCPLFYREVENCLCEEWRPTTTSTIHPYMTTRKKLLSGTALMHHITKGTNAYGLTQLESSTIQNKPFQCPPKIVMVPVMTIRRDGTLVSNRIDLQDIINKALRAGVTKTQSGSNSEGPPLNSVGQPRLDRLNYVNNIIPNGPPVYTGLYNYEDRIQTIPPNIDIESRPLNSVGEPRPDPLKYVNNHIPTGPAAYTEMYYYEDAIQTTPANIDIERPFLNSVGEPRPNGLKHVKDDIPTGPAAYTEMHYYEDTIQTTPPNTDLTVLPDIIDAYVF